jgi:hypothetical protein
MRLKLRIEDTNEDIVIDTKDLKPLFPKMIAMHDRAVKDRKEHGAVIVLKNGKLNLSKECIGNICTVFTTPGWWDKHVPIDATYIGAFHTHFESKPAEKLSSGDFCGISKNDPTSLECVSSDTPPKITCYQMRLKKNLRPMKIAEDTGRLCRSGNKNILRGRFYRNYSKIFRKVAERKIPRKH